MLMPPSLASSVRSSNEKGRWTTLVVVEPAQWFDRWIPQMRSRLRSQATSTRDPTSTGDELRPEP